MTDFGELYRQHAPNVFRFALYLSGDRGEAEDITSETFVRAWAAPGPIRMATVKGLLFTIARNLFLKSRQRRARHVELVETLPDPGAGPQEVAERDSELRAVLASLQKLPEVDRAALLMRAGDEMPYDEIARALGTSLAAVKVKIHRARLAMPHIQEA